MGLERKYFDEIEGNPKNHFPPQPHTVLLTGQNRSIPFYGGILNLFLDHVGPQNASFLRHICIAFPTFDNYLGSVTLQEDSIRTLELIRDNYTNLATLET